MRPAMVSHPHRCQGDTPLVAGCDQDPHVVRIWDVDGTVMQILPPCTLHVQQIHATQAPFVLAMTALTQHKLHLYCW